MIADEISVWHIGEFLAVLTGELQRRSDLVRNEIVHETCARGTRITQPHDLDRSWSQSEDLVSRAFRIAVHVHQNMDAIGINAVGSFTIAWNLREIDKMLCLSRYLRTKGCAIICAKRVTEDLDFLTFV